PCRRGRRCRGRRRRGRPRGGCGRRRGCRRRRGCWRRRGCAQRRGCGREPRGRSPLPGGVPALADLHRPRPNHPRPGPRLGRGLFELAAPLPHGPAGRAPGRGGPGLTSLPTRRAAGPPGPPVARVEPVGPAESAGPVEPVWRKWTPQARSGRIRRTGSPQSIFRPHHPPEAPHHPPEAPHHPPEAPHHPPEAPHHHGPRVSPHPCYPYPRSVSMTIVLSDLPTAVQEAVATTRQRVADLHAELPRNELVVWTAGNVSERVPMPTAPAADSRQLPGLFDLKPSGVSYDELTAETMVVCTLDGAKIDDGTPDALAPSSDTAAHAYVYANMPEVGGVVHTHSTYATAWAARGQEIPCVLTMMAD